MQPIQVKVGTVDFGIDTPAINTAYTQYTTPEIVVPAGLQTVALMATQCGAEGMTFVDKVELIVVNAPPSFSAFAVSPNGNQQDPVAPVNLSATAADPDAGGYVASIEFLNNGASFPTQQICNNTTTPPAKPFTCNLLWAAPVGVEYVLTAKATDDLTAATVSTANQPVFPAVPLFINRPPTVAWQYPAASPQLGGPNATVPLTVTVADPDGAASPITKVEFYTNNGATLLGTVNTLQAANTASTPPQPAQSGNVYVLNTQPLAAGSYTITARAYDSRGGSTAAPGTAQSFTVKATNNQPTNVTLVPSVPNTTSTPFNTALNVTAGAEDTDGGITAIVITDTFTNTNNVTTLTTLRTCTYQPAMPVATPCTTALPAGAEVGLHGLTAFAYDTVAGMSPAVATLNVAVTPSPMTCTLSANPAIPVTGTATQLTANCQAGAVNLAGVTIGWTGNCASTTTTTDTFGNATCTTNALNAASFFSITAAKANYSAPSTAASLTVAVQNAGVSVSTFTVGGQGGTVSSVIAGTNAIVTISSIGSCSSGETLAVAVNGTTIYGPAAFVASVNVPITAAATYQAVATRTCASPAFSATSPALALTVSAVTEPAMADVETTAITNSLTANGEVAGAIPGSATVNPSGAVTYSIGVPVAPGTAGMQPSLALQYSSQGGRGIVGTGWSLSGFSTIHRCPASVVLDGTKGRVGFDGEDRYCMDGMRLIAISGLDGAHDTEYRTERDSYARIYSLGSNGTGPTSWTVETKSGQTLTFAEPLYKATATGPIVLPDGTVSLYDSSKIKAWGITRAEDTVGNYMTFAYSATHQKGWLLPLSISYTGNTGASKLPYATVTLTYDTSARADSSIVYDGTGSYGEIPPLVTAITSRVDGNISQQLNIEYNSSPTTGRTRLTAVQVCGSGAGTSAGLCLKKTTFAYNDAAVNSVTPWVSTSDIGFSVDLGAGGGILVLDTDGNGKSETLSTNYLNIASYYSTITNGAAAAALSIYSPMCSFGPNVPPCMADVNGPMQLGDFNGDGNNDYVTTIQTLVSGVYQSRYLVCLGNGQPVSASNPFQCEIQLNWGSQNGFANMFSNVGDGNTQISVPKYLVGDFDGDGRSDVLELPGNGDAHVYLGFGASTPTIRPVALSGVDSEHLSMGDFDGDGRMDIATQISPFPTAGNGIWTTWLSRIKVNDGLYSAPGSAFVSTTTAGPRKHEYQPHIADINGDGLADILGYDGLPEQWVPPASLTPYLGQFRWQGCSSRGDGTFDCRVWRGPPSGEVSYNGKNFPIEVLGDYNGDGRTDVAIYDKDASNNSSSLGGVWWLCVSRSYAPSNAQAEGGAFDCGSSIAGSQSQGGGIYGGGIRRDIDASYNLKYDVVVAGDFDGNGRTALAGGTPVSGFPRITRLNIPDTVAKIPDMLASVTNGLGFTNSFTYKPITDSSVYTKYNSGNAYPELNIQTAMYVAATASHDDGAGTQQTFTYAYEGLRGHVTGGGTLGFAKVKVTDGKSGISTETEYANTYPQRGLVTATRKRQPNGSLLNQSTTSYRVVRPYAANQKIHSYLPENTTEESWDLNGAVLPKTTTNTIYGTYAAGDVNSAFGCATSVTATTYASGSATVQFSKSSTNTYDNGVGGWRWCRLRTAQVVSSQNVYGTETTSETRNSSFDYNATTGLLSQEVVQPSGAQELTLTTNYLHDSFGNRKEAAVEGWNGTTTETRTSKTTYDARGRFPFSSENAMGETHKEFYTWDERLGVQLTLTGPNGLTTTSKYDKLGRKVVELRADGSKSVMVYAATVNPFGGLTVTSRTTGGGESSAESDKLGRDRRKSVKITDNGTVKTSYVSTTYDARGRVDQTSRPYWSTATPVYPCSRVYDNLDRVSSESCTNDDGTTTSTATDYAYNNNALQTRVTVTALTTAGVSSTRVSIAEVDARGKSKKTTNTQLNTVEHAYDAAGNLTRTTRTVGADKMVTVIEYDLRGRKTSLSDPDTGKFKYDYNAFGDLLKQTDAKLQTIDSLYDKLGRVTQRTSGVDLVSNYTYDTCTKGIGRLCVVSASGIASPSGAANVVGHQRTLTYDSFGRMQGETTQIATDSTGIYGVGARNFTASTTFDAASRVKKITYPNGQFVTRQYDATGAWNKLVGSAGNKLWEGGNADAEARWLNWTLGNGLTTTTTFGAKTGRLSSLTTSAGVQGLNLTYDGFGNIKSRLDAANGYKLSDGSAETFKYDTLNQLIEANFFNGIADYTQTVTYDGFGRIVTKSDVAGTYQYPNFGTAGLNGSTTSNRVQSANNRGYTYDANGNVETISSTLATSAGQASGTITLSWTSFNQSMTLPVAAGQNTNAGATGNAGGAITLKYGADNGRVLEQLPIDVSVIGANQTATRFVLHSGASLFYEEDLKADGSSEARAYLTGPLGVVAVHTTPSTGAATLTYWHRDHLGSLTVTTNETGVVKDRMRFDPWGKPMTPLGARAGSGDRGFTGHEHLAGGLIHMNGRIYDPVLGRFLSADIVVQFPNVITSYNRYGYVMNNPLIYTDPSGYFIPLVFAWIAANVATIMTVATVAANVAIMTGHETAGMRIFFAGMFLASGGGLGGGFLSAIAGAFATGGLQSGSIDGAIVAAATAGIMQVLAPLVAELVTALDGAINNALGTKASSYTFNSNGVLSYSDGAPVQFASNADRIKLDPVVVTCNSFKCVDPNVKFFYEGILGASAGAVSARGMPKVRPIRVLGFGSYPEFTQAMRELQEALAKSGITDARVGVRGSAVTGKNFRTGEPFGPKSDIDVFAESGKLTEALKTSKTPGLEGMVHPDRIAKAFPELDAWSARWTEIAGRPVQVSGFKPGTLPANQPFVTFP